MTTLTFQIENADQYLDVLGQVLIRDVLKPAMEDAASVIVNAYRIRLEAIKKKPGNTGIQAHKAVGKKVKEFADGTGVWAVVGGTTVGGRMKAPQQRFGEKGTEKRKTKLGYNRGIMPAQRWLELSVQASMESARKVLAEGIKNGVARVRVS